MNFCWRQIPRYDQLRNQIIQHLDKIERLSQGLSPAERQQLGVILQDSRALLAELDRVLYNMFLVREKVGELAARIDWLHDDFTTELNSLVQDFTATGNAARSD